MLSQLQVQLISDYKEDDYDAGMYQSVSKDDFQVPYKRIRELSNDIENLVLVSGVVVQTKSKRHKAMKLKLRCKNCGHMCDYDVKEGLGGCILPKKCAGNLAATGAGGVDDASLANQPGRGHKEKCGTSPYVIMGDQCEYMDIQELKLQELSTDVPLGDMPRQITCLVSRGLCDRLSPGNKITFLAVPVTQERKPGRGASSRSEAQHGQVVKFRYLNILGYCKGGVIHGSGPPTSPEEQETFQQWAKSGKVHDMIKQSIAPAICSSSKDNVDMVKRAIACLLFGGSRKRLPDGTRLRGDINILLLGDPSTAKSQFLKYVNSASPICVYTSGKGSSAAGLTAAVIKNASSGGFALEGGAMVLADGGVVCIDEFDKMRPDDRVAIHEAMEQQTISIAKAGITVMLNTRCSVLAAANPIFGSYDDATSTADQIDFQTSILSRFDLIFLMKDVNDMQRDLEIARHVIKLRQRGQDNIGGGNFVEPPIKPDELKKFLAYAKRKVLNNYCYLDIT